MIERVFTTTTTTNSLPPPKWNWSNEITLLQLNSQVSSSRYERLCWLWNDSLPEMQLIRIGCHGSHFDGRESSFANCFVPLCFVSLLTCSQNKYLPKRVSPRKRLSLCPLTQIQWLPNPRDRHLKTYEAKGGSQTGSFHYLNLSNCYFKEKVFPLPPRL